MNVWDSIKRRIKRLVRSDWYHYSSEDYIEYLRNKGASIGENCTLFNAHSIHIDEQNPYMLTIGNYVRISGGTTILTHDYSFSVLASVCGDIVGSVEPVTIGNNVFIGMNVIILKGVIIGDNVIIGAGSVITRNCESNSVYAGVPGRRICSIEELYNKRKSVELDNAKRVAKMYYKKVGIRPDDSVLREYQMIFNGNDSKK